MQQIELLEQRIAPASVFTYTDVDGDQVKITSSKGSLQDAVTLSDTGVGKQLLLLDLRDSSFANSNINVRVKRVAGGDGFANIGFMDATGNDLGKVKIKGDLGRIVAGDANESTPAIKSLKVHSMGQFGLSTQGGAGTYRRGRPSSARVRLASGLARGKWSRGWPTSKYRYDCVEPAT